MAVRAPIAYALAVLIAVAAIVFATSHSMPPQRYWRPVAGAMAASRRA